RASLPPRPRASTASATTRCLCRPKAAGARLRRWPRPRSMPSRTGVGRSRRWSKPSPRPRGSPMPLDPQAKLVLDMVEATRVAVPPEQRVEMTRRGWGLFLQMAGGQPVPVFAIEERDADGVPVRVYRPSPDAGLPVFVVFHGGG